MKVIVCGGRKYKDKAFVYKTLDAIHKKTPITRLVQGGATGADMFAEQWAANNHIDRKTYNAEWKLWGKGAGPIRNKRMLYEEKPDLVVAFPGGNGTAHMTLIAKNAGVEVRQFEDDIQWMKDMAFK